MLPMLIIEQASQSYSADTPKATVSLSDDEGMGSAFLALLLGLTSPSPLQAYEKTAPLETLDDAASLSNEGGTTVESTNPESAPLAKGIETLLSHPPLHMLNFGLPGGNDAAPKMPSDKPTEQVDMPLPVMPPVTTVGQDASHHAATSLPVETVLANEAQGTDTGVPVTVPTPTIPVSSGDDAAAKDNSLLPTDTPLPNSATTAVASPATSLLFGEGASVSTASPDIVTVASVVPLYSDSKHGPVPVTEISSETETPIVLPKAPEALRVDAHPPVITASPPTLTETDDMPPLRTLPADFDGEAATIKAATVIVEKPAFRALMQNVLPKSDSGDGTHEDALRGPMSLVSATSSGSSASSMPATDVATTAPVETPPALPHVVVRQVRLLERQGESSVTVRLRPASLGEMRIELVRMGADTEVRLTSSTASTRALLESQTPLLRAALLEQGIRVSRIEIVQPPSDTAHPDMTPFSGGAGRHERHEPAPQYPAYRERHGNASLTPLSEAVAPQHDGALNVTV